MNHHQPPMTPIREATNANWDTESHWDNPVNLAVSRRASQPLPEQHQQQPQHKQGGLEETSPEFKMSKIQGFTLTGI